MNTQARKSALNTENENIDTNIFKIPDVLLYEKTLLVKSMA